MSFSPLPSLKTVLVFYSLTKIYLTSVAFFTVMVLEAHRASSIHQVIFFGRGRRGGEGASLVAHVVKNPPAMQKDLGSIPGLGRFPGGGHGTPFQYSYNQGIFPSQGSNPGLLHKFWKILSHYYIKFASSPYSPSSSAKRS